MLLRLRVNADGWVTGASHRPSANFDERPPGVATDLIVIHNISLPPGCFGAGNIQRLFANELPPDTHPFFTQLAGVRVSAHFLIERTGALTQFVSCAHRAWHAGASSFAGRARCNDYSIGIELEGTDFTPFEPAQYDTLAALVPSLAVAYPIAFARGHADIAQDRKTDPGPYFDWSRVPSLAALNRPGL